MKAINAKVIVAAALLAFGATALDAKSSDVAKGIAVGVAAGALIAAAAAAANADFDADYYDYSWGRDAPQNAVAACMHKAGKVAQKKGAYRIVAEKLDFLNARGGGQYKVGLWMKAIYPWGLDMHLPRCTVTKGWVSAFKLN